MTRPSDGKVVRHFGGTITVADSPVRVACIATGQFDSAAAVGVIPVAATANNSGELVPAHLHHSRYFDVRLHSDALAAVIPLGLRTAPDLSVLAACAPDLIAATFRGRGRTLFEDLQRIAPTVLCEGKGANWRKDFLLLADCLARKDTAVSLLTAYDARVAGIRRALGTRTPSVTILRLGPNGLETYGRWSFCGSIVADLGLRRSPGQDSETNGRILDTTGEIALQEELAQLTADRVFIGRTGQAAALQAEAVLEDRDGWRTLTESRETAVGSGHWFGHAGPLAAMAVLDDLERTLL